MSRLSSNLAFLGLTTLLLVVLGSGVGTSAGQPLVAQVAQISSVALPSTYTFSAISSDAGGLELSGLDVPSTNPRPPSNATCVDAQVDPSTLQIGGVSTVNCGGPGGSLTTWPVQAGDYTNHATVRIAHRDPESGQVSLGPVVMTWEDVDDTHLESIVGDGSLWLFDALTPKGTEVLRIPLSTGQVANVIHLPSTTRPILATDADGLWIGVAINGSYSPNLRASPIYHIAVGSNVAKLVFVGGAATFWLVASGHSIWDDIASTIVTPSGRRAETIWRFDGPTARRIFHTTTTLPFGVSVIGSESNGLWTVASQLPPGAGSSATTDSDCTSAPVVVRINPDTGRQRVVATLPEGTTGYGYECDGQDLVGGQAVIANKSLYLLDDVADANGTGFARLFRVRP